MTEHTATTVNATVQTGEGTMTMIDPQTTETDAAPSALYRLTGVTRTYRQKDRIVKALAGVDLDIAQGDFVTIQGPTGGGKSTLLQLLGALDRPSAGSVDVMSICIVMPCS